VGKNRIGKECCSHVGTVLAGDLPENAKRALVQLLCLGEPALRVIHIGEIVESACYLGVLPTQPLFPNRHGPLIKRGRVVELALRAVGGRQVV
jgi:hypothetical protein